MDFIMLAIVIYAGVILYLDIFKWDWLSKHQHRKLFSMYDWIEDKWGDKGVRITIGATMIAVIVFFITDLI
ncbi:hypothetical protein acsn021_04160 [Anaerocolumna cellulosilytica]|uniref:Uncharacterized protein n=1 Tax=Anaerocolumna cellulosilytica TaxID=433286 RepID=A0A6S6QY93_9FIRM|nr:hypothetical protein [Anaerocolumna cellulosilytica]MBB5197404.1 Na+/proline symporter [Anaerocolumna cellulosilytica]BCJ92847.1 hypothetical protein acsn021_04160 [Anaerocolumna cellulosilytica]